MAHLNLKPATKEKPYPQFEGDSAFVTEVNNRVEQYYQLTNQVMTVETACIEALAEMYNKLDAMISMPPPRKGKK